MRRCPIRKEANLHSPRRIRSNLLTNVCTSWSSFSAVNTSLSTQRQTGSCSTMLSVHPSRSQDQGSSHGLNASAFRFPFSNQEEDFSRFPRLTLEAKTKAVNTSMEDRRSDALKEDRAVAETQSGDDEDDEDGPDCKDSRNLTETFVAVIAQAVLSVPSKRMTLSSIYSFIARNFPHFDKEKGPGWRNSVRHNLSSNDCFVKASRAENGKGHYWMIHPKDLPEFAKGNYRRPRKPRRPRCAHTLGCTPDRPILGVPLPTSLYPYHRNINPPASLDLNVQHSQSDVYQHSFGVPPRYEYFPREESGRYPMNPLHGFSGSPAAPPPPPYGLFWQDHSAFRNYSHLQPSTFHPYLYMS